MASHVLPRIQRCLRFFKLRERVRGAAGIGERTALYTLLCKPGVAAAQCRAAQRQRVFVLVMLDLTLVAAMSWTVALTAPAWPPRQARLTRKMRSQVALGRKLCCQVAPLDPLPTSLLAMRAGAKAQVGRAGFVNSLLGCADAYVPRTPPRGHPRGHGGCWHHSVGTCTIRAGCIKSVTFRLRPREWHAVVGALRANWASLLLVGIPAMALQDQSPRSHCVPHSAIK